MTPTDELRAAAEALRPTPGDKSQLVAIRIPAGVDAGAPLSAVLADWLDSAARDAREIGPDPHALAVARAINGSQP